MDIKEIQSKKAELESFLIRLLSDFEQQTGTYIDDINMEITPCQTISKTKDKRQSIITNITLVVVL